VTGTEGLPAMSSNFGLTRGFSGVAAEIAGFAVGRTLGELESHDVFLVPSSIVGNMRGGLGDFRELKLEGCDLSISTFVDAGGKDAFFVVTARSRDSRASNEVSDECAFGILGYPTAGALGANIRRGEGVVCVAGRL